MAQQNFCVSIERGENDHTHASFLPGHSQKFLSFFLNSFFFVLMFMLPHDLSLSLSLSLTFSHSHLYVADLFFLYSALSHGIASHSGDTRAPTV